MSVTLVSSALFFVLSFLAGFVCLRIAYNQPTLKDGFVLLWGTILVGFIAAFSFNPIHYDSIAAYSMEEFLLVLGASLLIYLADAKKFSPLIIILGCIAGAYILPQDFLLFDGRLPLIADRLAIVAIWFMISFCWQYLNGMNGLVCLQTTIICLGLITLYFVGAAPFILALYSLVLLGCTLALLSYNWFPAYITLSSGLCQALGFICVWLLLKASQEGLSSSSLILLAYFAVEMISALIRLIIPEGSRKIAHNTNYYIAVHSGLTPQTALFSVAKILTLLLILACFQIYSGNFFSIPLLGLAVCFVFAYRIRNWDEKPQTLKEINAEFIEDVKEGIKEIKDTLSSKKGDQ